MPMRLVNYEPQNPANRKTVRNEIKEYRDWKEINEGVYIIVTNDTPKKIYSKLKRFIDEDDKLYIFNITQPAAGTGPDKLNDWVKANLPGAK
jgi:hypothetical protein